MRIPADMNTLASVIHRNWEHHADIATKAAASLTNGTHQLAVDDSAGLTIAERQRALARSMSAAGGNAQDAIALARVGQGAMTSMTAMLQRMRTMAVQAATGTYSDGQRAALHSVVVLNLGEMSAMIERTRVDGQSVLGNGTITIQTGAYAGQSVTFDKAKVDPASLGLGEQNNPGIDLRTADGAKSALEILNEALDKLFAEQAAVAAMETRMAHAARALAVAELQQNEALSRREDTDIAADSVRLAHSELLVNTSAALMAQVLTVQRSVLDMLLPPTPPQNHDTTTENAPSPGSVVQVAATNATSVLAAPATATAVTHPMQQETAPTVIEPKDTTTPEPVHRSPTAAAATWSHKPTEKLPVTPQ
ncbi:flagellin [Dermatophilus congolensis]|uniref:Flagellin n=1 Tax=Dermatophilus congolensis TaxID=1863 RepID=A0A239VWM3_9MICO|nr:flagellin [Dermatophilus congolensis]MBO3130028.1 hypothetical protein [Dermatophilus congolensis]MBO3131342.1 hypothetical protein [Dermatophilus congolensis]MBO3134502.1 hypothetical protein [Dermatophilus congolensis]MBO3136737.1 hypothetical protein [Dermatophilus congolensis]MBO3138982.1 hypothetical protein [Dermatophilus congolensis]